MHFRSPLFISHMSGILICTLLSKTIFQLCIDLKRWILSKMSKFQNGKEIFYIYLHNLETDDGNPFWIALGFFSSSLSFYLYGC